MDISLAAAGKCNRWRDVSVEITAKFNKIEKCVADHTNFSLTFA
jgi:hypothetical protein